ncbi:glycosyltransferase family 39 protein [Candidatus Woesebacteria bacterium]|nr:glycosyltransferase family 39 protein [Candidatus Woesebacteria bacterium]
MKKLIILFVVGLTILPFFKTGLFDVHDPTSAFRIYTLVETIKSGQFPASWSNLLNFGYGYPLHLFYAPLFGYLGALFYTIFGSYELAVKLVLVLSSLVGAFGIYKILEKQGIYASILGTIAYVYLPYRASAIYVRGSYSEFLAMSLLPWVIYFWLKPQNSKKIILKTAIITALFTLSHNTLPLLIAPVILLIIALFQRQNWKGVVLVFLATFGLTSWFILPVFFERGLVQVDSIATMTNYRDHFVTLAQLWSSPWGYGGSTKGVEGDSMSFMIGKGQLILALIGAITLSKLKKWSSLIVFSSISVLSIFLSLKESEFIWSSIHVLSVLQFPWRSLAVSTIGVAILSGYSLKVLPKKLQLPGLVLFSVLLIYTNFKYFHPQDYRNYTQNILSSRDNLDPLVRDKIPEYLPTWMSSPIPRKSDGLSRTSTKVYGNITTSETAPLLINTAYMPQWQLRLNNVYQPTKHSSDGLVMTQNDILSGEHALELVWRRTTIEQIGIWITALSIISVVGLLVL